MSNKSEEDGYFESGAGDGTTAEEHHLKGLPLVLTVISCVASLYLTALDQTITATIITKVGNQFHSFERIGWITSGYFLSMATLTPSYGKVAIAFGRKHVTLGGIFLFELGSLITALSTSMDMFIGGRVIQGIGGGAVAAIVTVILTESVSIEKRPLIFMFLALTYAIASFTGPFIGGAFATHVSWRWCFYINLPIGGLAALMLFFNFNPPKVKGNLKEHLLSIDYVGTFLISAGLVLIMLALTWGGNAYKWNSAAVVSCLVLGPATLLGFTYWNFFYSKIPILTTEIVLNRKIVAASMTAAFSFSSCLVSIAYLATYFQVIHNLSAWQSGIDILPYLLSMTVTSIICGVFIRTTTLVKPLVVASGITGPIGAGLFLLLKVDSSSAEKIGYQILAGASVGLQFQGCMISVQLEAPSDVPGSVIMGTVFLVFFRSMGTALALTVAQSIYQTVGIRNISFLMKNSIGTSAYAELSQIPPAALISTPSLTQELSPAAKSLVLDQIMATIKCIYYFVLAMTLCGLITSFLTTNKRLPKQNIKHPEADINTEEIKNENASDAKVQIIESSSVQSAVTAAEIAHEKV